MIDVGDGVGDRSAIEVHKEVLIVIRRADDASDVAVENFQIVVVADLHDPIPLTESAASDVDSR